MLCLSTVQFCCGYGYGFAHVQQNMLRRGFVDWQAKKGMQHLNLLLEANTPERLMQALCARSAPGKNRPGCTT